MDSGGCSYFRIITPSLYIEPYGFEQVTTNIMMNETMGWSGMGNKGGIAILQRQYGINNYENAVAMKKAGVKLIFEIDDYLHDVDKYSPAYSKHY